MSEIREIMDMVAMILPQKTPAQMNKLYEVIRKVYRLEIVEGHGRYLYKRRGSRVLVEWMSGENYPFLITIEKAGRHNRIYRAVRVV